MGPILGMYIKGFPSIVSSATPIPTIASICNKVGS